MCSGTEQHFLVNLFHHYDNNTSIYSKKISLICFYNQILKSRILLGMNCLYPIFEYKENFNWAK